MFGILQFLNNNEGALMVIITLVYVVATITICWANIESAKATREQLVESKRQYEDTKRLAIQPYLQCEINTTESGNVLQLLLTDISERYLVLPVFLCLKNIGNGSAKEIKYKWRNDLNCYDRGYWVVQSLESGEKNDIDLYLRCGIGYNNPINAKIIFTYQDMLDNTYNQTVDLCFVKSTVSLGFDSIKTHPPIMRAKETITHA